MPCHLMIEKFEQRWTYIYIYTWYNRKSLNLLLQKEKNARIWRYLIGRTTEPSIVSRATIPEEVGDGGFDIFSLAVALHFHIVTYQDSLNHLLMTLIIHGYFWNLEIWNFLGVDGNIRDGGWVVFIYRWRKT